jgi:saccharopine dehydrogenase-like NADP-dependent oxidoreductase
MSESVVVVLGGYGSFGRLVADSLCRHEGIGVIVAGRDGSRAARLCDTLGTAARPATLDLAAADFSARLSALSPSVVIDTVGPFQFRDYATARACLDVGAHYLDLADSREYVTNIDQLNAVCLQRGLLAASGASTCPALTTAVADRLCHDLETIDTLAIGVAPGHRVPRGLATTHAVLSYCGKSIATLRDGSAGRTFGWSGLTRHRYSAPIGGRWLSRVDLPELALWPAR